MRIFCFATIFSLNAYTYYYSRNAGVINEVEVKQNLIGEAMDRARAELDGRTGETDSETEVNDDGPGSPSQENII